MQLPVQLDVRAMDFDDLSGLEWSGSSAHLQSLAEALVRAGEGELDLVIITVGRPDRPGQSSRSVACGAVEFVRHPDAGELSMLSVHPEWQSLGLGTILIGACEDRIAGRGRRFARMSVEHDNPRAAKLYRRLGYVADGERVEDWSVGGRRRYVTTCTTLVKELPTLGQ